MKLEEIRAVCKLANAETAIASQVMDLVPLLVNVAEAAFSLREAQRAYMADRGNAEKGMEVGLAAGVVDLALRDVESYGKG